jgi:hypothetical protein
MLDLEDFVPIPTRVSMDGSVRSGKRHRRFPDPGGPFCQAVSCKRTASRA